MFRQLRGFKAEYHYLKLVIAADFDEWRVLVMGPGFTLQGQRQFGEAKAKDHAILTAKTFIYEEKKENLPPVQEVAWTAMTPGEYMDFLP
jgi:hypothetical protein